MNKALLISGSGHIVAILFMLSNGFVFINSQNLPTPDFSVEIISSAELDAFLSKKPDVITTQSANIAQVANVQRSESKVAKQPKPDLPNFAMNKHIATTEIDDGRYFSMENELPEVKVDSTMEIESLKTVEEPKRVTQKEVIGNESAGLMLETFKKVKPRTADRIDSLAAIKSESDSIDEITNIETKKVKVPEQIEDTIDIKSPKESSTRITPEGKKNVEIVVSGSVASSSPPPFRPNILDGNQSKKMEAPASSELLGQDSQAMYDAALEEAFLEATRESKLEVSVIQEQLLKNAVKQAVERHWDIGILIGSSNYEKYAVEVEFQLDKHGFVYGPIKPVKPKVLVGKYKIAFRQAHNALKSAQPFPISQEEYPNGVLFTMNFDPLEGLGF